MSQWPNVHLEFRPLALEVWERARAWNDMHEISMTTEQTLSTEEEEDQVANDLWWWVADFHFLLPPTQHTKCHKDSDIFSVWFYQKCSNSPVKVKSKVKNVERKLQYVEKTHTTCGEYEIWRGIFLYSIQELKWAGLSQHARKAARPHWQ